MEVKEYKIGLRINPDPFAISEEEIIDFARRNDPQKIHMDPEYARGSIFKGLISSGAQAYLLTHKKYWQPLTESTFVCGLEINNWKFLAPIYPEMLIRPCFEITNISPTKDGLHVIDWSFTFYNAQDELIQSLDIKVMHKITKKGS